LTKPELKAASWEKPRAERVNQETLAWLDSQPKRGQPVFLYIQYIEPHAPYTPPAARIDAVVRQRRDATEVRDALKNLMANAQPPTREHPQGLVATEALPDAEVASVDAAIGELLAALDRRGLLSNALVLITADHGEELLDHGLMGHARTLYNEVIHVPLIVQAPSQRSSAEIDGIVSLIDIAPTLLEMIGIAAPAAFEGHSFAAQLAHPTWRAWLSGIDCQIARCAAPRAFSQLLEDPSQQLKFPKIHRAALVIDTRKLIKGDHGDEVYDLQRDPHEQRPGSLNADEQRALARDFDAMAQRAQVNARPVRVKTVDAATREQMRALGYVH